MKPTETGMMSIDTYRKNLAWLEERRKEYPHTCRTHKNHLSPVKVHEKLPDLSFIRVPLQKSATWAFKTRADMRLFKQNYVTLDNKR